MLKKFRITFFATALASLAAIPSANAGAIIGGSSMLTAGYVSQLETWLGEGPINLTNIFTKGVDGSTSTDWHGAVDGIGRTISVFQGTLNGVTQILGGYNPQSWNSSGSYNITGADTDRTAFIFNLTDNVIQRQCLSSESLCGSDTFDWGSYQTFNYGLKGPSFGAGHDLSVDQNLSSGWMYNYSYDIAGGQTGYGWGTDNIAGQYCGSTDCMIVGSLETFTISPGEAPAAVPEPTILALFGVGLAGLGLSRRWRRP